jgi:hypothetical protein
MEIVDVFASAPELLAAYVRQRYPARIYLPLAVFLAAAATTGARGIGALQLAATALLAYTLVFQFRLWDDLSDRESDRVVHPRRVLARDDRTAPFTALLAAAAAANVSLLASKPDGALRVGGFVLLTVGVAGWYRWRKTQRVNAVVGYHVVLLKYPALALLISPPGPAERRHSQLVAAALVYLCFCVFEVLHDDRLRSARGVGPVLAFESVLLAGAPMLLWTPRTQATLILAAAVASVAVVAALLSLARRRRITPYVVFVAATLQLATLGLGG